MATSHYEQELRMNLSNITFTCLMLILLLPLFAQQAPLGVQPEIPDSLSQLREAEIRDEFGFNDGYTLGSVAEKLAITDLVKWKNYLNLEPGNKVLEGMTLRRLGITPYKALLAQQYCIHGFNELSTLSETAAFKKIPIKKLREMLGFDPLSAERDNSSLQALDTTPERIQEISRVFDDHKLQYGVSVTIVGMLIVFSALLITSMIISQLHQLNAKPNTADTRIVISPAGKLLNKPKGLNSNVIAAAVTALHLYKLSIEERRKLVLTFKRTPTNQWRASSVTSMPNREFSGKRR